MKTIVPGINNHYLILEKMRNSAEFNGYLEKEKIVGLTYEIGLAHVGIFTSSADTVYSAVCSDVRHICY